MYRVTLYPETNSEYVSELQAGLFELRSKGIIDLRFGHRATHRLREKSSVIQWMEVDVDSHRRIKVCFDTADWCDIASMDDLADADIYFKRSYHLPFVDQLECSVRHKVVPLGLHYGCSSRNESFSQSVQKVWMSNFASGVPLRNPRSIAQMFGSPFKRLLNRSGPVRFSSLPVFIDEFEVSPGEPAEPKVFYRTRVYGPNDAPQTFRLGRMDEINELRANIVRALKTHFGNRFVGGLRPSVFARQTYPDCMFPDDRGLRGHLELSKSCLVNVNTAGLHDSTSWKIPEYMAGSRCIVSEPMKYETPVPLIEGKHYLGFRSPEECVVACEELLTDLEMARAMRNENSAYYAQYIRPDQLMSRCLQTVSERGVAVT